MKLLVVVFGVMSFAGAAFASDVSVSCGRIQKKLDGEKILGVQVSNHDLGYDQTSWFGTNSGYQLIARNVCVTVLDSISCNPTGEGSLVSLKVDGDLGKYLNEITANGHYGASIDIGLNEKEFINSLACEEARSELAHEMVRNIQKKYLENPEIKILEEHSKESLDSRFWVKKSKLKTVSE